MDPYNYGFVMPSHEQVKKFVVDNLQALNLMEAEIQEYLFLKKNPSMVTAKYRAGVRSIYIYIRPKIIDYIETCQLNKNTDLANSYIDFVNTCDTIIKYPIRYLTLGQASIMLMRINQFSDSYGLTVTRMMDTKQYR